MTTLAILTSGDRPYLADTLGALAVQSWNIGRTVLWSDGPLPPAARAHAAALDPGWEIFEREKLHADNGAAFRALLDETAGDDLVFLEDDTELGKNALRFMALYPVPFDLAFVAWFEATIRTEARPALYRLPCEVFVYGQAMTIPARTVATLRAGKWNMGGGLDSNIATILAGRRFGQHVPALVQHVGHHSSAHPERCETPHSYTFKGSGYDVMDLFPVRLP